MDSAERRRHPRFEVRKGIYIATPTMSGELLNVSQGGLAFRYVVGKGEGEFQPAIVFDDHSVYLDWVPVRSISEEPLARKVKGFDDLKRHSVQFGALSEEQQAQVERFIMRNGTEQI